MAGLKSGYQGTLTDRGVLEEPLSKQSTTEESFPSYNRTFGPSLLNFTGLQSEIQSTDIFVQIGVTPNHGTRSLLRIQMRTLILHVRLAEESL